MNDKWDVNQSMIDNYLAACKEFSENKESFNCFKQDPRYTPVLEHVSVDDGNLYVSEMKSKELVTKEILEKVKENDKYGSPTLFKQAEFGEISPTTIRYLKNCLDIFHHFGHNTDYKKVVEIGGGYGGLCKVFSSFVNFDRYYLVDFVEANLLSKTYLDKFEIGKKIIHISTDEFKGVEAADLAISNYAFSECSGAYQKLYYEKIIKKSKAFYMVYNNFTTNNLNSSTFIEMASTDFNIVYETELRPPHVCHICYGTKKANEN